MWNGSLRHRATKRLRTGTSMSPAGAPYKGNGDDDEFFSAVAIGWCCCGFLSFLALGAIITLASILVYRVVPPKALSDTCDDSNPCTLDFLETVRGVDSGCCSHCSLPNAATCENACYDNPQCTDGECKGTCKGHCEDSNALDCPIIHAANLTALFDLTGTGNADYADFFSLYRECALGACIYTINIDISNVTYARDAFVVSRSKFFRGNDTNISATNGTNQFTTFTGWDDFHSNIICLPLIASVDRDCMRVIDMAFDLTAGASFDATCTYAYACADPPSIAGSIDFPVLGS